MKKSRSGKGMAKGSATIELALLMPVLLMVMILLIETSVFLYNRAAVSAAAYVSVLKGIQMEHEGANKIEEKVKSLVDEFLDGKLPFVTSVEKDVKVSLTKVQVTIKIRQKNNLSYQVKKSLTRRTTARFIWNCRRFEKKENRE